MRSELITAITTALNTLTQFTVSQELPWSQNNLPLFRKNMKKIYVDHERQEQSILIPTLPGSAEVVQNDLICEVYLAVDAKNSPSQLESAIDKILQTKGNTGIVSFGQESDYTVELSEDVQIFTFEFRLNVATT